MFNTVTGEPCGDYLDSDSSDSELGEGVVDDNNANNTNPELPLAKAPPLELVGEPEGSDFQIIKRPNLLHQLESHWNDENQQLKKKCDTELANLESSYHLAQERLRNRMESRRQLILTRYGKKQRQLQGKRAQLLEHLLHPPVFATEPHSSETHAIPWAMLHNVSSVLWSLSSAHQFVTAFVRHASGYGP